MSVILETSLGDITVDLFVDDCPLACKNFLKLCKVKYYNNCLFHNVQRNYAIQSGDPTGTGSGGDSLYGLLYGQQARYFTDEIKHHLKHKAAGVLGCASSGPNLNASQFYITAADNIKTLDERHTIFGRVAEGLDVVQSIADVDVDGSGRPLQNVRVLHTIVLDDPYPDPDGLQVPDASPVPKSTADLPGSDRLEVNEKPKDGEDDEARMERLREAEAKANAEVLEMVQDLPFAEIKPVDNVLFVCKLNPATRDEDLELIFGRFGRILSCEVIRDWKTQQSLCYAFIEYERHEDAEEAYAKMDNVLIDDRRIHVDFSQSVAKTGYMQNFRKKGGRWVPTGPNPFGDVQEQPVSRGLSRGRGGGGPGGRGGRGEGRPAPFAAPGSQLSGNLAWNRRGGPSGARGGYTLIPEPEIQQAALNARSAREEIPRQRRERERSRSRSRSPKRSSRRKDDERDRERSSSSRHHHHHRSSSSSHNHERDDERASSSKKR